MIDPRSDLRVGGVTAWIERPQLPDLAGYRILTNENFIAANAGIVELRTAVVSLAEKRA